VYGVLFVYVLIPLAFQVFIEQSNTERNNVKRLYLLWSMY